MLTPAGRDLVGAVMRHRQRAIAKLVRGLSVEDPQGLASALEEFVAAAGEASEQVWWRQRRHLHDWSVPVWPEEVPPSMCTTEPIRSVP